MLLSQYLLRDIEMTYRFSLRAIICSFCLCFYSNGLCLKPDFWSSGPLKSPKSSAEVPSRSHATVAISRLLAKRATVFGHCMGEDQKSTIDIWGLTWSIMKFVLGSWIPHFEGKMNVFVGDVVLLASTPTGSLGSFGQWGNDVWVYHF